VSALAVWAANVKTHNRAADSTGATRPRQGRRIMDSELLAKGTAALCSIYCSPLNSGLSLSADVLSSTINVPSSTAASGMQSTYLSAKN
jgi:hypothetical protein